MKPEKTGLPNQPEFSHKLQMADKEIQEIFDKYDLAGVAFMYDNMQLKTLTKIDPSYSCVRINEAKQLQINAPLVDPEHPELAKNRIHSTVNMIANLRLQIGNLYKVFLMADQQVRTHFDLMPKSPNIPPPSLNGKS